MAYPKNVRVACSACGTNLIVLPAAVYEAVGGVGGIEAEAQFAEVIVGDTAETGDTLTVADVAGRYTCPKCEQVGQLPPDEELYRLEAEQRPPAP